MVAKILFLPPSDYKINIADTPQKSKAIDKKNVFFHRLLQVILTSKTGLFYYLWGRTRSVLVDQTACMTKKQASEPKN